VTNKLYQNLPPSNSTRSDHPITIFAVSNLISLVLIGLSMVLLGQIPSVNQFSVNEWIVILYLALACTTTAFVLYIFASQSIAPTRINVILLLNLIIGLVLSALLLGDNLSFFMVVGSGFILLAIYLAGSEEHDSRIDLTTDTSL
jgi:drug/metabolite transporter (DMT)-like permease